MKYAKDWIKRVLFIVGAMVALDGCAKSEELVAADTPCTLSASQLLQIAREDSAKACDTADKCEFVVHEKSCKVEVWPLPKILGRLPPRFWILTISNDGKVIDRMRPSA